MESQIIAYGERPITEMVLLLSLNEDIDKILNNIKFKNHDMHNIFNSKSELKNIFIEAPLPDEYGTPDIFFEFEDFNLLCEVKPRSFKEALKDQKYFGQIERYCKYIKTPKYSGTSKLVKRITKLIKNNKTILILITKDTVFPKELDEKIVENKWNVGWLPYNIFEQIAKNHDYEIKEEKLHVWIEKCSSNAIKNNAS